MKAKRGRAGGRGVEDRLYNEGESTSDCSSWMFFFVREENQMLDHLTDVTHETI